MKRRTFLFAMTAAVVPPAFAQAKAMKIGIIGSGRIGSTFGALWAKAGHEVMFSDRDPEQAKLAAHGAGARARVGSVPEAVAFGDAILIAVPYGALPAIAQQVGSQLKGKVVIDPNNPVPSRDGELGAQAKEKGAAVSTAAMAQQKLKFAHVYETSEPYHTYAVWAAGEIAKRTNNKYTMDVFPASQLGNETQINQSLSLGTVDLIYTGQAFAARRRRRSDVDRKRREENARRAWQDRRADQQRRHRRSEHAGRRLSGRAVEARDRYRS